ncbi:MAG: hypothetical protein SOW77_01125 [Ruminococcus sp.]|nr:hypothetical protein [Ruminococcus sp.]
MFYVKSHLNSETPIEIELTADNIFTNCHECGTERCIDLEELLRSGGDLCSTKVYCSDCSARRIKK